MAREGEHRNAGLVESRVEVDLAEGIRIPSPCIRASSSVMGDRSRPGPWENEHPARACLVVLYFFRIEENQESGHAVFDLFPSHLQYK